jgi:hypothetical protein
MEMSNSEPAIKSPRDLGRLMAKPWDDCLRSDQLSCIRTFEKIMCHKVQKGKGNHYLYNVKIHKKKYFNQHNYVISLSSTSI